MNLDIKTSYKEAYVRAQLLKIEFANAQKELSDIADELLNEGVDKEVLKNEVDKELLTILRERVSKASSPPVVPPSNVTTKRLKYRLIQPKSAGGLFYIDPIQTDDYDYISTIGVYSIKPLADLTYEALVTAEDSNHYKELSKYLDIQLYTNP